MGALRLAGGDLHDVGAAVAARNLDDAEPVTPDDEPKRLRVDRRRLAKRRFGGQIVAVEANHRRMQCLISFKYKRLSVGDGYR